MVITTRGNAAIANVFEKKCCVQLIQEDYSSHTRTCRQLSPFTLISNKHVTLKKQLNVLLSEAQAETTQSNLISFRALKQAHCGNS